MKINFPLFTFVEKLLMEDTGYHCVWDIVITDNRILFDGAKLNNFFYEELSRAGFNVLGQLFHKFDGGGGVTGLFLLSESHLSYHTYPESNYISIDLYTCGKKSQLIQDNICDFFSKNTKIIFRELDRGSHLTKTITSKEFHTLCT